MRRLAACAALIVVGVTAPTAGAQGGPVLSDGTIETPIVLDPTDFDPKTITDTEVDRMRSELHAEWFSAMIVDRSAARRLDEALDERRRTQDAVTAATDHLQMLDSTIGTAAIQGYLSDADGQDGTFFGLNYESDATRADATAQQLLEQRRAARVVLADAISADDDASRSLRVAESRKAQSEASLEAVEVKQATFGELVTEYEIASARADQQAMQLSDEVELRSVAGSINVNAEIEEQVDELIADARADGIDLSGGSYRTIESQIALRLAHCGGSVPAGAVAPGEDAPAEEWAAYDALVEAHRHRVIYEVPSSACSPPTATPGNSEHQQGLAIDFTDNGSILDRSSDGYLWLVEHAEDYGLINLPSEAWHWSTTGN